MRSSMPAGTSGGASPPRVSLGWAAVLLGGLTLGRLALIPAFDLMPQEAYYSLYGLYPSLSYLDHAPMIGWLLYPSLALLGKSVWAVRLVTLVCTLLLQIAAWLFLRRLLDARRRDAAWVLLMTLPMTTGLSLMACPDVPLALFWTLSLVALHRAVSGGGLGSWLAAGVLMGLAFDSKYFAVFLQGGLLLFLLLSRRHRPLLRTAGPWLALLSAQAVSLPVYLWNLQHDFASFRYQSAYRVEELLRFDAGGALFVAAHQSALVGPVVFFGFLAACVRHLRDWARGRLDERTDVLFLLSFSVPLLLVCLAVSPFFWVKMNWLLPVYLAGLPLVALTAGRGLFRWQLVWVVLFHAVLVVELVFYPWPVKGDDTTFGWRQLAREVELRSERHPRAFVFSTDSYKTAAELRFYTDLQVWGLNVIGEPAYHMDYIGEDVTALVGRDGLLIDSDRGGLDWREELEGAFDSLRELEPIVIEHRGRPVRRFLVYLCTGYRGPPPATG